MLAGLDAAPVWSELAIILGAIALGSFIKGVTGSGLPQIAVPVIAIFLGVERAVVIMALPGVITNSWMMWEHRAEARNTRDLPMLLATGTIGAVIGTMGLSILDPAVLALVLASMGALYVTLYLSSFEVRLSPGVTRVVSPPLGLVAGVLQGSTGVSGPILTTYLHAYRLARAPFIFSLVTLFNVFAVAQVVTLFQVGLYSPSRLVESFLALVPMMIFLPLGARYSARLSQRRFDLYLVLLISGSVLLLTYDGISNLLR
jgi:uncharacterized membrane protein YfcA